MCVIGLLFTVVLLERSSLVRHVFGI